MFYNAYLVPIFDYCCTIWGKSNKSYIKVVIHVEMPKAAPKSPFVIFKSRDDIEMK